MLVHTLGGYSWYLLTYKIEKRPSRAFEKNTLFWIVQKTWNIFRRSTTHIFDIDRFMCGPWARCVSFERSFEILLFYFLVHFCIIVSAGIVIIMVCFSKVHTSVLRKSDGYRGGFYSITGIVKARLSIYTTERTKAPPPPSSSKNSEHRSNISDPWFNCITAFFPVFFTFALNKLAYEMEHNKFYSPHWH